MGKRMSHWGALARMGGALGPLWLVLACGSGGGGVSAPKPVIHAFRAIQPVVTVGQPATLEARFEHGAAAVDGGVGPVTSGQPFQTSALGSRTSFILTVKGEGGVATQAVAVDVAPMPRPPVVRVDRLVPSGAVGLIAEADDQAGMTFTWSVEGGQVTSSPHGRSVTFTAGTGPQVRLICTAINAAMARESTEVVMEVVPPVAPFPIAASESLVANSEGNQAQVTAAPGVSYRWEVAGGTLTSAAVGDQITFTAGAGPVVQLSCVASNRLGQSLRVDRLVPVVPGVPRPSIRVAPVVTSNRVGIQASVEPIVDVRYRWSISGGTLAGPDEGAAIQFTPGAPGDLILTCTASKDGLTSTAATAMLKVVAAPELPVIQGPDTVEQGQEGLVAKVATLPGLSYRWEALGGVLQSAATDAQITFRAGDPGELILRCTATNQAGDGLTAVHVVRVVPPPKPVIASFSVDREWLPHGGTVTLRAEFQGGRATVDSGIGSLQSGESRISHPLDRTTVFTLTVVNAIGETETAKVVVYLPVKPRVASGLNHTLVVQPDGTVLAWGRNFLGGLGDGTGQPRWSPGPVAGLSQVEAVAAYGDRSLALTASGEVWQWPFQEDVDSPAKLTPTRVPGLVDIVSIHCGESHNLALKADGTLWGWGYFSAWPGSPSHGVKHIVPVLVPECTGVVQVAGSYTGQWGVAYVLKIDGTLWFWGDQTGWFWSGSLAKVPGLPRVARVASESSSSGLAHGVDGSLWGWSHYSYGPWQDQPSRIGMYPELVDLAQPGDHGLGLDADGGVWSLGFNRLGELGTGTFEREATPARIAGLPPVSDVGGAAGKSFARTPSGELWAWGVNLSGNLGDGQPFQQHAAIPIELTDVRQLAAGQDFVVALREDGSVWSWGKKHEMPIWPGGRLPRSRPEPVPGLVSVVEIAAGANHALARKADGTVWVWGSNTNGQFGNYDMSLGSPVQVEGLTQVVALAAHQHTSLALRADGTVWGWGAPGLVLPNVRPGPIPGLAAVRAISLGSRHALAILEDGVVVSWGHHAQGALGRDVSSSTPKAVPELAGAKALAAGRDLTLALMPDSTVKACGADMLGRLGTPSMGNEVLPVSTPRTIPGLSGVVALAPSPYHPLVLCADGTVWGWGRNDFGELGGSPSLDFVPPRAIPGLTSATAIAAGYGQTLALTPQGLFTLGTDTHGQQAQGRLLFSPVPMKVPGLGDP